MSGTLRGSTTEVRAATIGHFVPTILRSPTTCTSTHQACTLSATTIAEAGLRCASRDYGLLSAPLSYVRSGHYSWLTTNLNYRGSRARYWISRSHTNSESFYLTFYSTNLDPKPFDNRGYGYATRCVSKVYILTIYNPSIPISFPPATTASSAPHYRV